MVVLITGVSSGFGLETARLLSQQRMSALVKRVIPASWFARILKSYYKL